MSLNVFPRLGQQDCVSHWQISLLVLDLAEAEVASHAAVCPDCARLVAAEQQAMDMVRLAKPSSPLARSTAAIRQWRQEESRRWLGPLLLCIAVVLLTTGAWYWWQGSKGGASWRATAILSP